MKTPLLLFYRNFRLRRVKSNKSVTFSLYISTRETLALKSIFDGRILTLSMTNSMIRGSKPLFSPVSSGPTQVNVLPEAVCP